MPAEYRFAYCSTCNCVRQFRKRTLDRRFHAALTAATLGLWSIGWASLAIRSKKSTRWRCGSCHRPFDLNTKHASTSNAAGVRGVGFEVDSLVFDVLPPRA